MVLVRNIVAGCVLLLLVGCLKSQPVQRLSTPEPIAVAVVHDLGSGLGRVPRALISEVKGVLDQRNLVMNSVGPQQYQAEFSRKLASKARMKTLQGMAPQGPLHLLVETRAEFYSQLNGRFRWTVYVKLSLAKGDGQPASVSSFSLPVLLNFDHQREEAALAMAAAPIARKLGQELDDFLAGLDLATSQGASTTSASLTEVPELDSIYFVMIDRFANGDPSNDGEVNLQDPQAFHGGDLSGLIKNLDHIQGMGFRTLWLSPLFSMRTEKIGGHGAFHGYWTEDLREVEARFGNRDDLKRLKGELSARGMGLVMDMVLNHVGYDTKLVTEKPSWFHKKGTIKDWDDPEQITTYDVHGLPDLNQQNPAVYDYLLSASAQWIEDLAPVGFRLDAVKHVGGDFWNRYTREVHGPESRPLAMIGELYNGDPAAIARGFTKDGFSHLFDFPLYFAMNEVFCKGEHAGRLASILSLDRLYPDPTRLITFADNHDLPRVWSACGEEQARVQALLTFMLTARGIPSVNYGTEALMAGKGEPQNRGDMRFDTPPPLASLIERLLGLRREHSVFRTGRDQPWIVDKERYAYFRVGDEESALVAVNLADDAWTLSHPALGEGVVRDALTGEPVGKQDLVVAAGSTRVLLLPATRGVGYQSLVAGAAAPARKLVVIARADASALRLVGGGPELGDWNPELAPRGTKLADGRFRFEVELPRGSTGAFKLVRVASDGHQWEERGNRYLTAVAEQPKPLEISFGTSEEGQ